jgi:glycosyltransferase involved in cell wall biosynthesis
MMKVSVIMLTYNHEKFITQAINGVIAQKTNFPFELIIANDCSTDNTEKFIQDFKKKNSDIIKGYCNIKNIGPKFNFIKAYQLAQGDYIAMCEGDDYWNDCNKLQKQFDFMESNKDFSICFHDIEMINATGQNILHDRLPEKDKKNYEKNELLIGAYLPTPTIFYKKFDIEPFIKYFRKTYNGDTLLQSILTQNGKIKYLENINGSVVRIHDGGIWSSTSLYNRWNHSLNTVQTIFSILDKAKKEFVFKHFDETFEMATWGEDIFKAKKYWIRFNLKFIYFLLTAKKYGKAFLIFRRIFKKG